MYTSDFFSLNTPIFCPVLSQIDDLVSVIVIESIHVFAYIPIYS